jgi:fibronectin type 3 domain-containing protein
VKIRKAILIFLVALASLSGEAGAQDKTTTNLTLTVNHTVTLNWTGATGDISYNVYRSTNNGGPYTKIDGATSTTFTDFNVTSSTTYYYVVTAINNDGVESIDSNQATAVVP